MNLPNETKIRFCNAFAEMNRHHPNCTACAEYLAFGNGDLCDRGKAVIGKNLAYADTDHVESAISNVEA